MSDISRLEALAASWEFWGYVCTGMVLIGVIGETAVELFSNAWKSEVWRARVGSLAAIVLIAGIAGEILTQVRTNNLNGLIIAYLNEHVAIIEQNTQWRRITPAQHDALVAAFEGRSYEIELSTVSKDPEAILYCEDILNALHDAQVKVRHCDTIWDLAVGLQIPTAPPEDQNTIRNAFDAAHIPMTDGNGASAWNKTRLEIVVGSKPPPNR